MVVSPAESRAQKKVMRSDEKSPWRERKDVQGGEEWEMTKEQVSRGAARALVAERLPTLSSRGMGEGPVPFRGMPDDQDSMLLRPSREKPFD